MLEDQFLFKRIKIHKCKRKKSMMFNHRVSTNYVYVSYYKATTTHFYDDLRIKFTMYNLYLKRNANE